MLRDNYQHVNQYIATAEIMTHYMYLAQHLNAKMSASTDNAVWSEPILSYNYPRCREETAWFTYEPAQEIWVLSTCMTAQWGY